MKNFIFFTNEGYTYDISHNEANNMQLLGDSNGIDVTEAFKDFKIHQSYIYKQNYTNILTIETIGKLVRLKL